MNVCRWILAASAGVAMMVAVGHAQQIDPEHGAAGTFVAGIDQKLGGPDLPAARRQDALTIAGKLRDILDRDQAVTKPVGYSIRANRVYGKVTEWANFDSGLPFYAGAIGTFFPAEEKPGPTYFKGVDFGIYVNTVLQCPLDAFSPPDANGVPWKVNGNLPVLEGGRRTGDFRGYSIYDGQCVIIGRSSVPPFVPLTREQYIQLEIAGYKDRLDKMNKQFAGQTSIPAVQQAVQTANQQLNDEIAQLQQQLTGMSTADRNGPAAVQTGYQKATLAGMDEDGAIPLSVPNPAFFDRALPATTVQSVAVYIPFLQAGAKQAGLPVGLSEDWRPATENIRDGLDWAAVASLVR